MEIREPFKQLVTLAGAVLNKELRMENMESPLATNDRPLRVKGEMLFAHAHNEALIMSVLVDVGSALLKDKFGELVQKVGTYLMHHGGVTLADIIKETQLKTTQVRKWHELLVKKCLCVLIQHQLVTFEPHSKTRLMAYRISVSQVILTVRFPRYINTGKVLFGDAGELIVEDLLRHGQARMSECIQRVSERLEESLSSSGHGCSNVGSIVKEKFVGLVEGRFLQRVAPPSPELVLIQHASQELGGATHAALTRKFELPPNVAAITYVRPETRKCDISEGEDSSNEPKAKRKKLDGDPDKSQPDASILWHLNFDLFHQYFRDQAVISAVSQRIDSTAGCIVRVLLSLASSQGDDSTSCSQPYSAEVYSYQVAEGMPSKPKLSQDEVDQYLRVIAEDDSGFLCKTGVSGGGVYKVDFKRANDLLCLTSVELVVRERFGSKAHRIFRLIHAKKLLEQNKVAELAMLPGKEAKEILYTLLAESFLCLQEVPRTADYAPSRTFYLFSVNLNQVVRVLQERCYKALGNIVLKRIAENSENKRLLAKYELFEQHQLELQSTKTDESLEEEAVEEILTPEEKKRAESIRKKIRKLDHAELQLDETILTISNYLCTHSTDKP